MSIEDRNRMAALEQQVSTLRHDIAVLVNVVNQLGGSVEPNDMPNVRDLNARVTAIERQRVKR